MIKLNSSMVLVGKSEFNVSSLTKALEIVNGRIKTLKQSLGFINGQSETMSVILEEYKKDVKVLEKAIRKANFYRSIKVDVDYSYDYDKRVIRFPKDVKKKTIYKWLENNNIPTKSQRYHISSPYDCTGEVRSVDVEMKNNIVTVIRYFDV